MKNYQTIKEMLARWGSNQRQFPANNNQLKSEMLANASISPAPQMTVSVGRNIPWLTLALSTMTVISIFVNPAQVAEPVLYRLGTGAMMETDISAPTPWNMQLLSSGIGESRPDMKSYYPNPAPDYYYGEIPITDTREFIKTDYNANMRVRNVGDLVQKVQITIKGLNGRVDGINSSSRYGYVSFVIPANELESFKIQLKSFVNARFYEENISSQNLLSQKRAIEEQQTQTNGSLSQLKNEKNNLTVAHNRQIGVLNAQLAELNVALSDVTAQLAIVSDPAVRTRLLAEQARLNEEKRQTQNTFSAENTSYANKINLLDVQIKNYEKTLANLSRQDKQLLDSVATVRGTIGISWISVLDIMRAYSPINLTAIIFLVATIVAYLVHRRRTKNYLLNLAN